MSGHGSLDSVVAKFYRARDHFETLNEQIAAEWGPTPHYQATRREVNPEGTEHRFYVGELKSPDPALALIFGDCLFNLRCALDHLVHQLHVRHLGGPLPGRIAKRTAFPIFGHHPRGRDGVFIPSRLWKEIGNLPVRDRAQIKLLQPYVRLPDESRRTNEHVRLFFVREGLALLNRLHNFDKHRDLHVVLTARASLGTPEFAPEFGFEQFYTFGPVESHAEIERWTFTVPPPDVEMYHYGFPVDIAIEIDGEWFAIPIVLQTLLSRVARVIEMFADRFQPSA